MNEGLIPNRYAKALYKYAKGQDDTETVYAQMKQLGASYAATPTLKKAVDNHFLPSTEKENVLLTASGAKEGDCLARFITLVIGHNRENFMREIAIAYQKIYRKENNIAQVEITTASALPEDRIKEIVDVVKSHLEGKTIEQSQHIDANLLGGFVVKVDSLVLDASIKNELKKLRLKLLSK